MKALSIRQPWCHFILNEGKIIENRSWSTRYRGPVLLHAAKGMTNAEWDDALDLLEAISRQDREANSRQRAQIQKDMQRGGIVGVVDIVDCVADHPSPWFFGRYGFVLANPRPLPFVPCKGALGFFTVPNDVMAALGRSRDAIEIDQFGGNCPFQADGKIGGNPFYFRSRGSSWSMSIGGPDVVMQPEWHHEEGYGEWPDAGWISEQEALAFINKAASLYLSGQPGATLADRPALLSALISQEAENA